jgi:single-stranded DNA-binding protein
MARKNGYFRTIFTSPGGEGYATTDSSIFRQKYVYCRYSSDVYNLQLERGMEENMTDKVIENNQVAIMGEIVSDFTFSHEIFGEGFYMVDISVDRLSESTDIIPVMMSERLLDVNGDYKGAKISIVGQFRSYNRHEERKNKLVLSVFAREIEFVDEIGENAKTNQIFLDGYICKPPIYRKTPLGREIADLLLAVNRPYGKSDYIPCICWGRNARFASGFEVGSRCAIWGRIQSREYMKKLSEEEMERRVAYEVSVSKLEIVEE